MRQPVAIRKHLCGNFTFRVYTDGGDFFYGKVNDSNQSTSD
ncbi:hypothetical protein [Paracholeplasma manati]|nr:hypothetical protein [Paracholeplasma manati]MDG0888677.1 hypothetical protein [Paracholeplasma manati]